jgi:SPP1 gp7 family putative phage head morphogenesis protein
MAKNFNSKVADQFTMHAIDLEKFKAGQRNAALKILKKLEQDLVIELSRGDLTRYKQARLQALLQQTRATIESAYKTLRSDQLSDWQKLMQAESKLAMQVVNRVAGVQLLTVAASDQVLKSLLSNATIQGGPAKEWWNRQATATFQKFGDIVRGGVLKGSPTSEIVPLVRQMMQTSARSAEALIRTGINAVATDARLATFQENQDVVSAIQQHSTLDARTTDICKAYSGATYTNDENHDPVGGTSAFPQCRR